jgi:hypothetical protein
VVSSITVDSQTVNFIAAVFRIGPAETVAGYPKADVSHWLGTAAATPTVAGVPEVDVTHWIGTAAATPTVAGVPEVDVTHIAGAAVSAASAQLGVNVVQMSGSGPAADNLETAALAYSVTRGLTGTALPAAAADAAGGLPISDAGGLDLDDLKADVTAIMAVETGLTLAHAIQNIHAACAGESAGGGTATLTFRDKADTKDRITATVDADGNRSAVVLSQD